MGIGAAGVIVVAGLTITVVLVAQILISANRVSGTAVQESSELFGDQARTAVGQQPSTTSTGKRLTVDAVNAGTLSISDYRNMDVIVEYQSNDTGNMVYRRLPYIIPAITFDAVSDFASSALTDSLTWSHTVADFNSRILIVGAQAEATPSQQSNCTVNSVTYNSVALTEVDEAIVGGSPNYQCVGLWYLLTPPVGTFNVVVTWAGNLDDRHGGAMSLYNAAQQGPEAQNTTGLDPTVTITTAVTTVTDGAWLIDAVGSGNPGAGFTTLESGQTERYENAANSSSAGGSTKVVPNATTTSMGWSQAANRMAHVVAAFTVADSAIITDIPAPNEWIDRYRTPDAFQPDIWDASETLRMRGILLPRQESDTIGTVTVSTPNGVVVTSTFSRPQWLPLSDAPSPVARGGHLGDDGTNLYAFRGATSTDFWHYNSIDELDPIENTWSSLADAPANVTEGASLAYAEDSAVGYLYALLGAATTTLWRYDITGNSWSPLADTPAAVGWGATLEWDNFDILYAFRGDNTDDFWSYTISTDSWSTSPGDPASTVERGGAMVYVLGDIYALRGNNQNDFWCYCSGSWGSEPDAPGNVGAGGALVWDGLNYVYAWQGGGNNAFWRYLIPNGPWEVLGTATMPAAVDEGGDLHFFDGDFYGLGGDGQADLWTYQPRGY